MSKATETDRERLLRAVELLREMERSGPDGCCPSCDGASSWRNIGGGVVVEVMNHRQDCELAEFLEMEELPRGA